MPKKRNEDAEQERTRYQHGGEPGRDAVRVGETQAVYLTEEPEDVESHGTTRLSSKNQITLPVHMVRELGLTAGDEIDLLLDGETIQLERRPRTPEEWVARYQGSTRVPGWETRERIDAYVRGERESWT